MHETPFSRTEGRFLGLGLALTGLMLLALGIGWHLFPDSVLPYAIMTGLNLIIGRQRWEHREQPGQQTQSDLAMHASCPRRC